MLHVAVAPPSMTWAYSVLEWFMVVFPVLALLVGIAGVLANIIALVRGFELRFLQRLLLWTGFMLGAAVLVGWMSLPTLSFNILPSLGVNTMLWMIDPETAAFTVIVAGVLILASIVIQAVRLVRWVLRGRTTPAPAR